MTRSRPLRLAVLALVLALPACSTVPSSSPTVQITQVPDRTAPEVGIEPASPEGDASPEEIVRGFIDAAASTGRNHPIAREYLTPEAADAWDDAAGITVIGSDYALVTTGPGVVTVTATTIGEVDQRGVFSVSGGLFTRDYTVAEVDGEWRITDPPDGLVILEPDFERLYDEVDVFFPDPTGRRLVPDPRYLISGEAQPTVLVDRLFDGPSSALRQGVRNPMEGLSLRRAVTVEGTTATVDFAGLPEDPDQVPAELFAQLVWTLDQAGIRSVLVLVDGERVQIQGVPAEQTVDDWASFDPDAVPVDGVGHYLDRGTLRKVPGGEPVPGPAGEGEYPLTGAAAAADPRTGELSFLVGVTTPRDGESLLLAGPYGEALTQAGSGSSFTAPTVAATRSEVWVVRDGSVVVRLLPDGAPQPVAAPTLPELGEALALQLSPDGVRAAVVVERPDGPRLYVANVVRTEDGGVSLRDLREVAPALSQVADVAWRDSGHLMVLAGDAAEDRIVPYVVGIDGWGLDSMSTAGLPSQPTSVAAAPTRAPLVSAGRQIWQFNGANWITLIRGEQPLSGTEPFFPL
jgi:Lipoprotein LpqB beta-propeller domain/Sporulation and spore germination